MSGKNQMMVMNLHCHRGDFVPSRHCNAVLEPKLFQPKPKIHYIAFFQKSHFRLFVFFGVISDECKFGKMQSKSHFRLNQ